MRWKMAVSYLHYWLYLISFLCLKNMLIMKMKIQIVVINSCMGYICVDWQQISNHEGGVLCLN